MTNFIGSYMGSTTKFLFFTNNDSLTSSVYKIIYVFSIFLKGFFFKKKKLKTYCGAKGFGRPGPF